jgi:hypothetical protein
MAKASMIALVPSAPIAAPASVPVASLAFDADFERRWAAWRLRGEIRQRAFNRRLVVALAIAASITILALAVLFAWGGV